jgi:hypothetical protein
LSATINSIERSIQAYELKASITSSPRKQINLSFDVIKSIIDYVKNVRSNRPGDALLDVGGTSKYLFLSDSNSEIFDGIETVWLKFGWARRSGLPEALNAKTGRVEVLRLGSDVYLFEPSHFLLFRHDEKMLMLYEYNKFSSKPSGLCRYLEEFYKRMKGDPSIKVKISAYKLLTRDVEKLLQQFNVVKSLRIELESASYDTVAKIFGESSSMVSFFRSFGSKYVSITWRSSRRGELEVSPSDVLEIFRRLGPQLRSLVVTVSKGTLGRSTKIDLKKCFLVFKRHVMLAHDSEGNILRTTDTQDAIKVLKSVINEVISQL